nr:MAG TPA: hypothetical protein [Caudoviricetes sp.]
MTTRRQDWKKRRQLTTLPSERQGGRNATRSLHSQKAFAGIAEIRV